MIYLHIQFQRTSFRGSLFTATKTNAKNRFHSPSILLLRVQQKIHLKKRKLYLPHICYRTSLHDPTPGGASAPPPPCCYYRLQGIKKNKNGVASNGITFIPISIKIHFSCYPRNMLTDRRISNMKISH
jgi:hypothetical protein